MVEIMPEVSRSLIVKPPGASAANPLEQLLCCPGCKGRLGPAACVDCDRAFSRRGRQWVFVEHPVDVGDGAFQGETVYGETLRAKLFNFRSLLSSEFQARDHLKALLKSLTPEMTVVELGSGPRRLGPIINVDLFPFPNVDLVADIAETPLADGVADCVILDSVIEHVPNPVAVVAEAHRILKPGGLLFVNCPFMLPYHGYPKHYQNYTRDGLEHLLRHFSSCSVTPTFGPMTAWVNMTAETFAVMVGGERGTAYVLAKGLALLPIFWLKYLDVLFVRAERSHRIAGMLCAQAVK